VELLYVPEAARPYLKGTHALIDLNAYASNLQALRSMLPSGSELMAVVKADAYGHGMVHCAFAAEPHVDWFGVARIQEGIRLRRAGVIAPILVLGPPNTEEIAAAQELDITLTVGCSQHLAEIAEAMTQRNCRCRVHLKVDTGMRRYGFMPDDAIDVARAIVNDRRLDLDGIYTHFSSADELDPSPTTTQIERFQNVVEQLGDEGIRPRYSHAGNSAAILTGRLGPTNLARAGIATYGLSPSEEVPIPSRFRPVLSLRTVISRRFTLAQGEGVSYGLSYRAPHAEEVATTTAGYADGLPRQLSNRGWFVVDGEPAPIRGRVCMDQTVVSVRAGVRVGDVAHVFGPGDKDEMTLDAIARFAGTNTYEIATRVTARVPRLYVRDDRVVAWEHLLLGDSGRISEAVESPQEASGEIGEGA
jgi:alanine racemase